GQHIDPQLGVDTACAGILRFPGNRLAVVDGSVDVHMTHQYEVAGSIGTIRVDQAYVPHGVPTVVQLRTGSGTCSEKFSGVDQFTVQSVHFVRSVRAGRLLPPIEDGVAQAA